MWWHHHLNIPPPPYVTISHHFRVPTPPPLPIPGDVLFERHFNYFFHVSIFFIAGSNWNPPHLFVRTRQSNWLNEIKSNLWINYWTKSMWARFCAFQKLGFIESICKGNVIERYSIRLGQPIIWLHNTTNQYICSIFLLRH